MTANIVLTTIILWVLGCFAHEGHKYAKEEERRNSGSNPPPKYPRPDPPPPPPPVPVQEINLTLRGIK